jgi:hypothetical protein
MANLAKRLPLANHIDDTEPLNTGRQGRNYFSRNGLAMLGQIGGDKGISQQLVAITKTLRRNSRVIHRDT